MKKFMFKTTRPTGSYGSFFPDHHSIKYNKIEVGSIGDGKPFKIRLQVKKIDLNEDGNLNCPWKWITLNKKSESLDEAKKFLSDNVEKILSKFSLWLGGQ